MPKCHFVTKPRYFVLSLLLISVAVVACESRASRNRTSDQATGTATPVTDSTGSPGRSSASTPSEAYSGSNSPERSGSVQPAAAAPSSTRAPVVFKAQDFGVRMSFDNDGKATYGSVKGMAGVGTSEQEAIANLTPVKLGKDPDGKAILYIEQQTAVRGLKVFYIDATSGADLDKAMWPLFEIKDLESRFIHGDGKAETELRGYLRHNSALVREAAKTALERR